MIIVFTRVLIATAIVFTMPASSASWAQVSSPPIGEATPRMDPDMRAVLEKLAEMGARPIEQLTVEEARRQASPAAAAKALAATSGGGDEPSVERRDITWQSPAGARPARVYMPRPQTLALTSAPPAIVYFHGGGWVLGDIETYDGSAAALAAATSAAVVSFTYRKAPEHPLPAAYEDAVAAYRWTLDNAAALGIDAQRLALAGESAGGNLAAHVALRLRDDGQPALRHLALIYPVAGPETNLLSYAVHADAKPVGRAAMEWFLDKATGGERSRVLNLLKSDVAGLPATTIVNAQIDPLLSDGQELAGMMRRAGVDVRQRTYDGVTHEFFGMTGVVGDAKIAQTFLASRLRDSLQPSPSAPVRR